MMRMRKCRIGLVVDIVLILLILILGSLFMFRKNNAVSTSSGYASSPKLQLNIQGDNTPLYISTRVLPDTRPKSCKNLNYGKTLPKATFIFTFHGYEFYDLKITLNILQQRTPEELIEEIIVVDDGTTVEYIRKDSDSFLSQFQQLRVIRNSARLGPASSRLKGAHEAKLGATLVFLDHNVACNEGWLEPLLHEVELDSSTLATPLFDSLADAMTMKYTPSGENLTHVFTWGMRTVSYMTQQYPSVSSIRSSVVMRGHVFAVQNEFFQKIGGYDPTIELGGGENLELSFRAWMCGGNIKVVPCSRVGVLALNHPLEITNGNNIKRIVELWLSDRRGLVLRDEPDADIVKSVQARKTSLKTLECHDFSWFLKEVAPFLETPKHIPNQFGTLYVKSGYCARRSEDNILQLGECRKNEYSPTRVFHLHTNGKLLCGGSCLTLTHSRFITIQPCNEGDDNRQHWKYEDTGEITTKDPHKEGDKLCMMHVTDPDKANNGRQILMVQHCHIGANHDFQKFVFNVF